MLPFDAQQFFAVFAAYNAAIWPAQILAYVLGAAAVASIIWKRVLSDAFVVAVLAVMWL